jgi:hypothetical protein
MYKLWPIAVFALVFTAHSSVWDVSTRQLHQLFRAWFGQHTTYHGSPMRHVFDRPPEEKVKN